MDKEELLNLGVEEGVADAILDNVNKLREDYEARVASMQREYEAEMLIRESGAKNADVVRAMLKMDSDVAEQIERLKSDRETSFLFEGRKSFEPNRRAERLPDTKKNSFEERLKTARREGNTLEAIRIKQQAAGEGVMLL